MAVNRYFELWRNVNLISTAVLFINVLILGLFNDVANILDYIASNGGMISKL
jgi:hypothetical protein